MSSAAPTKTARDEFWDGVKDETPLMLGVFPFGMVFGVLGIEAGLEPLVVMAMSVIVFGGASQVVFAQMASAGASVTDTLAEPSVCLGEKWAHTATGVHLRSGLIVAVLRSRRRASWRHGSGNRSGPPAGRRGHR